MPIPYGTVCGWPSTKMARWAWMWYATCSEVWHWTPSIVWPVAAVPGAPDDDGDGDPCRLNRYSATKITARATTVMPAGSSHGGRVERRLTGGRRAGCGRPASCGGCPERDGAAVRFLLMARHPILHAPDRRAPENRLMSDRN